MLKIAYDIIYRHPLEKNHRFPMEKYDLIPIKLIKEKIAIKIDVEGHELNVLQGMRDIIEKNKCVLQIEVFQKNYDELNKFLISLGYKKTYEVKDRSNYFYNNFN